MSGVFFSVGRRIHPHAVDERASGSVLVLISIAATTAERRWSVWCLKNGREEEAAEAGEGKFLAWMEDYLWAFAVFTV